jgi:4-amino-4-deoxy-L-arabinose transferase-like glycosyltransferase
VGRNQSMGTVPPHKYEEHVIMNPRSRAAIELATVAGFCAFLFLYGLGSFGLVGADEPRYAQIAREMLARHDWVTPVLNGTAWLEKPVLYYWGAMISYSIFGVYDWAARLPTAVLTSLMVVAIWLFMRRFRPGSQLDSALIVASLAGVIGFARAASTDMPLAAMFTIGMIDWYQWYETRQKRYLCGFYFFLALATLAKGPVAPFLAALVIVCFATLRRDWRLIAQTLWIPGVLLYLAVALPWFVLVQHANPQFLHVFIFEHNLARYSTNMFRHRQPFWYYGPVLLAGVLPWLLFVIGAFTRTARECKSSSFHLYFAVWAAVPIIFFSFSQSKLPGYILPAIPPLAILTGEYLWHRIDKADEPSFWMTALHAVVVGGMFGASLLTVYFVLGLKPAGAARTIAIIAGAITFAGVLAAVYGKGLRVLRLATLLPLVLALGFVVKYASPAIDARNSARPIAAELAAANLSAAELPVSVFGVPRDIEYGLNFYENAPIPNYDRGEIPPAAHRLVAKAGSEDALHLMMGNRVTRIGEFPARKLEFYIVSAK